MISFFATSTLNFPQNKQILPSLAPDYPSSSLFSVGIYRFFNEMTRFHLYVFGSSPSRYPLIVSSLLVVQLHTSFPHLHCHGTSSIIGVRRCGLRRSHRNLSNALCCAFQPQSMNQRPRLWATPQPASWKFSDHSRGYQSTVAEQPLPRRSTIPDSGTMVPLRRNRTYPLDCGHL
jgi:hypothetical protein